MDDWIKGIWPELHKGINCQQAVGHLTIREVYGGIFEVSNDTFSLDEWPHLMVFPSRLDWVRKGKEQGDVITVSIDEEAALKALFDPKQSKLDFCKKPVKLNNGMNIFFDLDETLIHSSWDSGQEHDFVTDCGPGDIYYTSLHPQALGALSFARDQVGAENVRILTVATKDYALIINKEAGLGFKPEQIIAREALDEFHAGNRLDSPWSGQYNILIDNKSLRSNFEKTAYLDPCSDYLDVVDYTGLGSFVQEDFKKRVEEFILKNMEDFKEAKQQVD